MHCKRHLPHMDEQTSTFSCSLLESLLAGLEEEEEEEEEKVKFLSRVPSPHLNSKHK